jgi:hypothetical protein
LLSLDDEGVLNRWLDLGGAEGFELGRGEVAEGLVQARVI